MSQKLKSSVLFILNTLNSITTKEYEVLLKLIDVNPTKAKSEIKTLFENYNRSVLKNPENIKLTTTIKKNN